MKIINNALGEDFVLENHFSLRSFVGGIIILSILCVAFIVWSLISYSGTLKNRFSKIESVTVLVERAIKPDTKSEKLQELLNPKEVEAVKPQYAELERYSSGLVKAPVEGLYNTTEAGKLPVKREDGLTPFLAYRREFDVRNHLDSKAMISIAVIDFGLSSSLSGYVSRELPENVTLVLSPYADEAVKWSEVSRTAGHELWIGLPLEPSDFLKNDTGSLTLMADTALDANVKRLDTLLGRTTGYAGVIASGNNNFYSSEIMSRELVKRLCARGLGYGDTSTESNPYIQSVTMSVKCPYVRSEYLIDDTVTIDTVGAKLDEIKDIALERGYLTIFVKPLPATMEAISKWLMELEKEDIVLVPLSAQAGVRINEQ